MITVKMLRVIPLILSAFLFVSCSSTEKSAQTAEALYKRAQEYENDDRFEEAIRRYQEVRSKYPYSPQAIDAEMAVADVYYKQESYPEAQTAYQSFRDLHPKHAKMPYVLYRYALSLYMQLPETIDRDMSLAPETILAFNDVLKKFPQSEFAKESGEKRSELIRKMAEKEIYIADFYYKKAKYLASLGRYEYVLKQYGGVGFDEKATARAAFCSHKIGDAQKTRQYADKLQALKNLSGESQKILKEIR